MQGVDDRESGVGEVVGVTGREGSRLGPADRGDLSIEAVDGLTEAFPGGDDVGIRVGRREVEGKDLAWESGEDFVGRLVERLTASALGQAPDAVPDLSDGDRRRVQAVTRVSL